MTRGQSDGTTPSGSLFSSRDEREGQVVARLITFNAARDPMFRDQDGNGWVPLARYDELDAFLRRIVHICDTAIERCNVVGKPPSWWAGTQIDPARLRVQALQVLGEAE